METVEEPFFHVIRHTVAQGIGLVGQGEVGLQMIPDDVVQRSGLGVAPTIGRLDPFFFNDYFSQNEKIKRSS